MRNINVFLDLKYDLLDHSKRKCYLQFPSLIESQPVPLYISVCCLYRIVRIRSPGQKHTSNDCSKQCASLNLNPIDDLLDLLKHKVRAQLYLRELARVIHQMCAAIPQQYIHRHILSMSTYVTMLKMRHQVDVQSIETKSNTT